MSGARRRMDGQKRDHGGGLDAAAARFGGAREDWLDLSTGINPCPYPVGALPPDAWTALPDAAAMARLEQAARSFWNVPERAEIAIAGGASALIAALPWLKPAGQVAIEEPTYNEHRAAFEAAGWEVSGAGAARVLVHPNNPTGRWHGSADMGTGLTVIDESFADVAPVRSMMGDVLKGERIILKSFGKFWGLAGLRLGFAIGRPELIGPLRARLGPWAASGPALEIGARALEDWAWAEETRARLAQGAARLDAMMAGHGTLKGGTDLFRLYDVGDAAAFQAKLAERHIWSRIFPYSQSWVRLGLPDDAGFARLEAAL